MYERFPVVIGRKTLNRVFSFFSTFREYKREIDRKKKKRTVLILIIREREKRLPDQLD